MRQTIRALGWIIVILWITTLLLPVTVAFSLMKLLEAKNMGIQEPTISFSNGNFTLSMPFYMNNTGFYDLSDISINIKIGRENKTISTSSTQLPNVPAGTMANSSCDISFSLEELVLKYSELLTNDTELGVNASLRLRVAYAIAFEASMEFTIHWDAPLYNLTIYDVAYNSANRTFSFSISFDNHAPYPVNGTLTTNLYNSINALIGSDIKYVNVPSRDKFNKSFAITLDPTATMTPNGVIRLYFAGAQISEKAWTFP